MEELALMDGMNRERRPGGIEAMNGDVLRILEDNPNDTAGLLSLTACPRCGESEFAEFVNDVPIMQICKACYHRHHVLYCSQGIILETKKAVQ